MKKGWFWICPIFYDKDSHKLGPRFLLLSWLFEFVLFIHHSMLFGAAILGIDIEDCYPIRMNRK
jgi:hypothetical protein